MQPFLHFDLGRYIGCPNPNNTIHQLGYWSIIADVIILKHNDEFISGLEALKSAPDSEIIMRDYTSKYDFEHSTDYILRAVILENNDLESKRATNPEAIKFVKEERKRLEKERKEKEKLAKKK